MGPPTAPGIPPIFFQKVMFFIDGTNLLTNMSKELGIDTTTRNYITNKHPKEAIQAASILLGNLYTKRERGVMPYRIIRKYWFSSYKGDDSLKIKIAETLRGLEFEPVLYKRKNSREKGVDIALTMRMFLNAIHQNFDIGLLVAGDEDYLELVNEVKRYGPRVEGAFMDLGLSNELKLAFDYFTYLNPKDNIKKSLIDKLSK